MEISFTPIDSHSIKVMTCCQVPVEPRVHERVVAATGAMHLSGGSHLTSVCLPRMPVTTGQ